MQSKITDLQNDLEQEEFLAKVDREEATVKRESMDNECKAAKKKVLQYEELIFVLREQLHKKNASQPNKEKVEAHTTERSSVRVPLSEKRQDEHQQPQRQEIIPDIPPSGPPESEMSFFLQE